MLITMKAWGVKWVSRVLCRSAVWGYVGPCTAESEVHNVGQLGLGTRCVSLPGLLGYTIDRRKPGISTLEERSSLIRVLHTPTVCMAFVH